MNISAQVAWLQSGGQVSYGPVLIKSGRVGHPTPVGDFHVLRKVLHDWSYRYNAPMPNAVYFTPDVAFHEGSLSVTSHGCIHLSAAAAQRFYTRLQVGDQVRVAD